MDVMSGGGKEWRCTFCRGFRVMKAACARGWILASRDILAPGPSKSNLSRRMTMGLLEELAGAAAAVEGAKKLDPNAGVVTEGVAAIAGFEGTEALVDHFEKKDEQAPTS